MMNSPDGNPNPQSTLTTAEQSPEKQTPSTEIIPPALDTALRTAGVDTRDPNVSKAIEISLLMFSGSLPLPPPTVMAEYNSAFPGLVEKIVSWTEEQRQHRMRLERVRTEGSEARFDRGQWIAGAVALGGLALVARFAQTEGIRTLRNAQTIVDQFRHEPIHFE